MAYISQFYKDIIPYIDPTSTDIAQLVPDLHILTQNYRTRSGVLNLASCIVEILYRFFPSMMDRLPREVSLVDGATPIFLEDTTMDELLVRLFGQGDTVSYEFGAEQAIIVRNEIVKKEIKKRIGTALVLTVYEAKGLEFEVSYCCSSSSQKRYLTVSNRWLAFQKDVLCYNFFADSQFTTWRVLYGFDSDLSLAEAHPDFTDVKHRMLCSELKGELFISLYLSRLQELTLDFFVFSFVCGYYTL